MIKHCNRKSGRKFVRFGNGFSLAELIIATSLVGVVVLFIGSIVTSQLRQNASQESRQRLVEEWSQTAEFIESELFLAERAYIVDSNTSGSDILTTLGNACNFTPENVKLGLAFSEVGQSALYSVEPLTIEETSKWKGPFVLKRCGPLNTADGRFTGQPRSTIIIGSLSKSTSFSAERGVNSLGESKATRDISMNLEISTGSLDYSGTFGGQARVSPSYNLIRDEVTTGSSCSLSTSTTALLCGSGTLTFDTSATGNCPEYTGSSTSRAGIAATYNCYLSRVRQFYPTDSATIIGTTESGKEDAVFFNLPLSAYTITGQTVNGVSYPCSRTLCVVSGDNKTVTIYDGDVLVFSDRELRI